MPCAGRFTSGASLAGFAPVKALVGRLSQSPAVIMLKNSMFDFRSGERARELLEDFEVIATLQHMALIPRQPGSEHLRLNVRAAVVASTLRLSSVDYARRRYVSSHEIQEPDEKSPRAAYTTAYRSAKAYMSRLTEKLQTSGRPDPSVGVFGASLVLERLAPSFFCAHFLYRMGHKYEGHAVARLILEQIAWAYAAHHSDDLAFLENIETTRSVGALKRFLPEAGRLYGFLSTKTHIDYSSHMEFLRIEDGKNVVLHAQPHYEEYAEVILRLADIFGLVWEASQSAYLDDFEAIDANRCPKSDRAFLAVLKEHLCRISELAGRQK